MRNDFHIYAIDIDGTALKYPEKVNEIYDWPLSLVVLYTARPECEREKTIKQLKDKGIRYHALVMDKLRADVYIDDKNEGGLQWPTLPKHPFEEKEDVKKDTAINEVYEEPSCINCKHNNNATLYSRTCCSMCKHQKSKLHFEPL